jgi:hypothetical protein
MIKRNGIFVILLVQLVLVGCSGEQNQILSPKAILSLKGNISEVITRSSTNLPDQTQTGVYALETGSSATTLATTPFENVLYTTTENGGRFISSSPIVLECDKSYLVCAYAPCQNVVSDPLAVLFPHGTDVLYAAPATVTIAGTIASATLVFGHEMAQIKFVLTSGTGFPVLTGATLEVTGFYASCALNLADGVITPVPGNGATVTMADQSVCFVPDTRPMTLNVTVTTTDGRSYKGTILQVFTASYSYNYTLTLNNTELEVSGRIIDWVPVKGGSVSVTGE